MRELSGLVMDYFESLPECGKNYYAGSFPTWEHQYERCKRRKNSLGGYIRGSLTNRKSTTVMQICEDFMTGIDPRNKAILASRMGLSKGGHIRTLDAVGRDFQITRERVRQIVDKHTKQFLRAVKLRMLDTCAKLVAYIRDHNVSTLDEIISRVGSVGSSKQFDRNNVVRMLLL